jgi:hypothetical protein
LGVEGGAPLCSDEKRREKIRGETPHGGTSKDTRRMQEAEVARLSVLWLYRIISLLISFFVRVPFNISIHPNW